MDKISTKQRFTLCFPTFYYKSIQINTQIPTFHALNRYKNSATQFLSSHSFQVSFILF